MTHIGIVAIGRNEGPRLERCLTSLRALNTPVVYVDSGSSDHSLEVARSHGAEVVQLDPSSRFTAARARNAGFARLLERYPHLTFVQFIDGDCALTPQWLDTAAAFLTSRNEIAIVTGRLTELHRDASPYNTLCALEWEKPIGEIQACGGIFMIRASAFAAVNGFRDNLAAGEEGELCLRLREKGHKIWSLDTPMASHDADMTRFAQWWRRAKRAGYAYAEGASLHGHSPDRHNVRDCQRIWFWGLILPVLALLPAWWMHGWSLLFLLGYPILAARIYTSGRKRGWSKSDARLYACFTVLAKWPALLGMLAFHLRRPRTPQISARPPESSPGSSTSQDGLPGA